VDQPPGLDKPLGHRGGLEPDIHHQPGDDLRDQRSPTLRGTARLSGRDGKIVRGQYPAEGPESELLEDGCGGTPGRADRIHETASMPVEVMAVLQDHSGYTIHRLQEALFVDKR